MNDYPDLLAIVAFWLVMWLAEPAADFAKGILTKLSNLWSNFIS